MNVTGVWHVLESVTDPEIPVVGLVEMGIIRDVSLLDNKVTVTITPTFSACPALHEMKKNIVDMVRSAGFDEVEIKVIYAPPWSSDWIMDSARKKLKNIGLMPPSIHNGNFLEILIDPVPCPYCESTQTTLKNSFGPTPCRMIYYCNNCIQPFEYFKPL